MKRSKKEGRIRRSRGEVENEIKLDTGLWCTAKQGSCEIAQTATDGLAEFKYLHLMQYLQ
jgi:hypothetical protein